MVKKSALQDSQQKVTRRVGYGLITLTFVTLLLSFMPFVNLFSGPLQYDYNYTLLLVSYVFTAIAPLIVGYLAGGAATRSAYISLRRYNAVLFGVLGVWVWAALSLYGDIIERNFIDIESQLQDTLLSMLPAVLAAVTTIILGFFYAKETKHQKPLIDYLPYRGVLFGTAIASILAFGVMSLFGLQYGADPFMTLLINMIVPTLFVTVLILAGFWILSGRTGTTGERIVYSLIAFGFGAIAVFALNQLTGYVGSAFQQGMIWVTFVVGFIVWVTYLLMLRRCRC